MPPIVRGDRCTGATDVALLPRFIGPYDPVFVASWPFFRGFDAFLGRSILLHGNCSRGLRAFAFNGQQASSGTVRDRKKSVLPNFETVESAGTGPRFGFDPEGAAARRPQPPKLEPVFSRRRGARKASPGDTGRRVLNIVASLILLAIASPVMLLIAFLVKATSPGPVFYSQPRVGLDRRSADRRMNGRQGTAGRRASDTGGKLFTIYKFRTMTVDDRPSAQVWASPEDPRITRIGNYLRKYRLDELPQLFNVLRGEMNLVGPRPEQPVIFQDLKRKIDAYQDRQKVLPGITGWAQVNNAYDQSIDDVRRKVNLDLEYIESASVAKDLKIMAKTLPVMVFKKGSV